LEVFFCPEMKFEKTFKSYKEQLELLKNRGLTVQNEDEALRWLRRVSYYRLSAYFIPFKEPSPSDMFLPDATFERISDLYIFDCRLRNLFMIAMERIEVSVRTTITYELAHTYGKFAHTDPNTFSSWFLCPTKIGKPAPYVELMENIAKEEKRTKELFVNAYRTKYTSETHLPIWMVTELMSFGTLSMMFEGIKSVTKTKIAATYKLAEIPFQNWIHVLSTIRNLIAHHSRLWNRTLGIKAVIPHDWKYPMPCSDRSYCVAVMIQHLLSSIGKGTRWKSRLFDLFDIHPKIDLRPMGFPDNWRELGPWK
jgi:abortive infection bacteriophage resistance protein